MNVLIIGGGGREHALAWKTAQSTQVTKVYVAPGNAGTALESKIENVPIEVDDVAHLLEFAKDNDIELTIVGPEAPLVIGLVDTFNEAGLPCFGPSKYAAQLEGSKTFSKDFLVKHNIPTARYASFTECDKAIEYIRKVGAPIVVKADGLAAGKGVIVAQNEQQAIDAVTDMLKSNTFGQAGSRVVIEEFLQGEEASFIVMVDGKNSLPLATSQDHKARDNGDLGPNTGGMGAYSPAPVVTDELHDRIMREVIEPTVRGMAEEGHPYVGFLYAGIMLDKHDTPKVLEFNCRFGDPETQPIMMRLKSDLVSLCQSALQGKLDSVEAEWDNRTALGVVMAAGGYPNDYKKGDTITGLPDISKEQNTANSLSNKVFHAGTANVDGDIVTAGGRVLCVVALGDSIQQAQDKAYEITHSIHWENAYYRNDIGYKAITRNTQKESV